MTTETLDITGLAGRLAEMEPAEVLDIGGGRSVAYLVEFDQFATLNDFDNYGRTEWVKPDRWGLYPHAERPEGFDGSACILSAGGESVWWQPPDDWKTLTTDTQRRVLEAVYRILECGFQVVTVELYEGQDHYGKPVVRNACSYGGVEPWEYGDLSTLLMVLPDLLGEVLS